MVRYLLLTSALACSDYEIHQKPPENSDRTEAQLVPDTGLLDTGLGAIPEGDETEDEVPPEVAQDDPPVDQPDQPVYLHTGQTLYSWNPSSGQLRIVGNFETSMGLPVDEITDIAIDGDGRFYGVSYDTLYGIDGHTAEVWPIASLQVPLFGLTCTSDGRLVGGGDGLFEIDTTTGQLTTLVPEGQYMTSGDLVGLPDGLLYWAVREGDDLVVVDPFSGITVPRGEIGVTSIYGLGYADGSLYGFTEDGRALEIDATTGQVIDTISLPGAWWGATTNPVVW